jgi:fatty-acyl-CoA synthase
MPKLVRIRESLPITPIGKIFKPALRLAEMAEAAKDALSADAVPADRVEARTDPKHGSLVVVAAAPEHADRVRQTLEAFAFVVEVEAVEATAEV